MFIKKDAKEFPFVQWLLERAHQKIQRRLDRVVLFVFHCDLFSSLRLTDIKQKDLSNSVVQFCKHPLYDVHLVREILKYAVGDESPKECFPFSVRSSATNHPNLFSLYS